MPSSSASLGSRRNHLRPRHPLPRHRPRIRHRPRPLRLLRHPGPAHLPRRDCTLFAHQTSGRIILFGVLVCLIGVAVNGAAGYSKENEITPEEKLEAGERDYNFGRGIAIAILAGFMSSFFAFGLDAGKPIAALAKAQLLANHRLDLWANLPVLIVVLWGGFITNFIWSAILIFQNGSIRQFAGEPGINPMRAAATSGDTLVDFDPLDASTYDRLAPPPSFANYIFAAMAGVIWYFQFFFYSMGQTKMGKYDFSSWTLHMASIIIFATLWGLVILKEWHGTSIRTKAAGHLRPLPAGRVHRHRRLRQLHPRRLRMN
jgi:L-rhamnose-H+ transport protein